MEKLSELIMIEDSELENSFNYWLDHYKQNGDKHYSDTKGWKILELYFHDIIDRVLEGLPEMTEIENEIIVERIYNMF